MYHKTRKKKGLHLYSISTLLTKLACQLWKETFLFMVYLDVLIPWKSKSFDIWKSISNPWFPMTIVYVIFYNKKGGGDNSTMPYNDTTKSLLMNRKGEKHSKYLSKEVVNNIFVLFLVCM